MAATPEQVNELLRLAYQGNLRAQFNLGEIYFDLKDYAQAIFWHRKAAESGYAESAFALGLLNQHGLAGFIPINPYEAFKWYQRASTNGHVLSLVKLAACYSGGSGVRQDPVEAHALGTVAASKIPRESVPEFIDILRELEVAMTPAQLEAARIRAHQIQRVLNSNVR